MKYELYLVGGFIRDRFLGLQSKDMDYTVVMSEIPNGFTPENCYDWMVSELTDLGYEIFPVPNAKAAYTIRAKFPKGHKYSGVGDFVLSRKEVGYVEGTRQPIVEMGTLEDDIFRRDFTVNAIAEDSNGNIIDLCNGRADLNDKILRTPTDAAVSFNDDPLRILRALRFACTKGFLLSEQVVDAIRTWNGDFSVISTERVDQELNKMLKHDTYETLNWLWNLQVWNRGIYDQLFPKPWRLMMTNKT